MSDDIARQGFWSWNNAKPAPKEPTNHSRTPRHRRRRSAVAATHVLLVRLQGKRQFGIVADRGGDVEGTEAFCLAELKTRARHYPNDEFRVMPWDDAKHELRRKTWSVTDDDHIPVGGKVLLRRAPVQIHPSMGKVHEVFGLSRDSESKRTGIVRSRYHRSGDYMVAIDGTDVTICVERSDLIYPVPDNVVPLERRAR